MNIEHIALYVKDLERAKEFFVLYLHGKANELYHNKETGFRSYFISFDDGARLELMTRPETMDSDRGKYCTGYAHVAFSLGSKSAVDELTIKLNNNGYEVLSGPRTTGDGYYESSVIAIENNIIELTE